MPIWKETSIGNKAEWLLLTNDRNTFSVFHYVRVYMHTQKKSVRAQKMLKNSRLSRFKVIPWNTEQIYSFHAIQIIKTAQADFGKFMFHLLSYNQLISKHFKRAIVQHS